MHKETTKKFVTLLYSPNLMVQLALTKREA